MKTKDPGNVTANRITALENERNRRSRENERLRRKAILLRVDLNHARAALLAIGNALNKAERNRFGKLEFWADARQETEQLRLLAVAYQAGGSRDVPEQCAKVAMAAFNASNTSREDEDKS